MAASIAEIRSYLTEHPAISPRVAAHLRLQRLTVETLTGAHHQPQADLFLRDIRTEEMNHCPEGVASYEQRANDLMAFLDLCHSCLRDGCSPTDLFVTLVEMCIKPAESEIPSGLPGLQD